MTDLMRQYAPFPTELADLVEHCQYRPNWRVWLEEMQRDTAPKSAGGLTLVICTRGYDSYHPEQGEYYRVKHYFGVPAATYNRQSWQRWLFEQFLLVERHEAMEFFQIGGARPYAPNHGPGEDPYIIRETTTDEARRTSFIGVTKEG